METNILSLLISGAIPSVSPGLLWGSGVELHDCFFVACAIDISSYGRYFDRVKEKDRALAQFAVRNVIEESARSVCAMHTAVVDGTIYLFACLLGSIQLTTLYDTVKAAHKFLRLNFDISFISCMSRPFDEFELLVSELPVLQKYLLYMKENGDTSIIRAAPFASYDWANKRTDLFYEKTPRLYTLIRARSYNEAYDLLQKIVAEHPSSNPMLHVNTFRLHTLVLLLIESIESAVVEYAKGRRDLLLLLRKIEFCQSLELLPALVQPVFRELDAILEENSIENTDDAILYYISDNLSRPSLSVSSVASHFDISAATVGRIVRKKTGSSPSEHIQLLRFKKAKELIDGGITPLDEIASAVGCSERRMLGRIFVKYAGMTPSEYRRRLRRQPERV